VDAEAWSEIDRQSDCVDFSEQPRIVSFSSRRLVKIGSYAVSMLLIRLPRTCKNHDPNDFIAIRAFEVFGTLLE
jgi:hypothetical protein